MNVYTATGNLTSDPDAIKEAKDGKVCNFRIAVNPGKDKPALFFNCECWNGFIESFSAQAKKGDPVLVSGELLPDVYTGNDGTVNKAVCIRAREVRLLKKIEKSLPAAQ